MKAFFLSLLTISMLCACNNKEGCRNHLSTIESESFWADDDTSSMFYNTNVLRFETSKTESMYLGEECPHPGITTCENGSIDIFNLTDKDISLFFDIGDLSPKVEIAKNSSYNLEDIAGFCNGQIIHVRSIEYK
jgi:hypothetical protein